MRGRPRPAAASCSLRKMRPARSSSMVMAETVAEASPVKDDISVWERLPCRRRAAITDRLFFWRTSSVLAMADMGWGLLPERLFPVVLPCLMAHATDKIKTPGCCPRPLLTALGISDINFLDCRENCETTETGSFFPGVFLHGGAGFALTGRTS
ncbi:hypothetical protein AGR13a_Lc80072 [Agrobacterium genomosp. 13 str. CFBP 6927]|uniref:Uncharacterized protein n=1 Tax=Agrobacterium genomosp. 13 str. CFBP 6927 TaxID=1183428 RepID=A0ABP2BQ58_9HYPH|nr:hypothetical protein AGR13a_Lc80072 [Agrobacterium genomosp. 13 str. CFBP 6927]